MSDERRRTGLLGDIVSIVALIILGLILIWGAYHIFSLSKGWIASLFPRSQESSGIVITAPGEVRSGTGFDISWKNKTGKEGGYAFAYQCKSGLSFVMKNANGEPEKVPCGTAYRIPLSLGTSISLKPTLTGASTTVPFSIILATGTSTPTVIAQGNSTLTVLPGIDLEPIPGPGSAGATENPRQPAGQPDLAVTIIAVGYIDPGTDQFVVGAPTMPSALSAVQFDIANVGSATTGSWVFSAVLPTGTGFVYRSPSQVPLAPGEHILNTLRFSGTAVNGETFTVTASDTRDMNTKNDSASTFVPGNPYPQYAPTYQYYQPTYDYIYY
ncbi:hypothetical protein FJY94_02415 [Candidatus Kaiserbacteria bacterium]|nr:hypothetical protein [Candidatus Kaiserbacteria bacterium]